MFWHVQVLLDIMAFPANKIQWESVPMFLLQVVLIRNADLFNAEKNDMSHKFFFKKWIPNYASKAMIIKACNITEIRGLGPNIAFVKCHTSCTEDL